MLRVIAEHTHAEMLRVIAEHTHAEMLKLPAGQRRSTAAQLERSKRLVEFSRNLSSPSCLAAKDDSHQAVGPPLTPMPLDHATVGTDCTVASASISLRPFST